MLSTSKRNLVFALVVSLLLFESESSPRNFYIKPQLRKQSIISYNEPWVYSRTETRAVPVDYMLPTAIAPVTQFNRLQPFVNGNLSIIGYSEITFDVFEATPNVTLHQADLNIDDNSVTIYEETNPSALLAISSFSYDSDKEFWTATLSQDLLVGTRYVITMDFEGTLNSGAYSGFFVASYQTDNGTVAYAATQFEPNSARNAFPCFDEPAQKAIFTTELIREDFMMSASNMPLEATAQAEGQPGWMVDHYVPSEVMSSYQNSFLVSDFGYGSLSDGSILYKTHARNELVYATDYSLTTTSGIINYFEGYLSVAYPMPKLDSNALPEFFAGAMENWGLMNYIDYTLIYDEDVNPAASKQLICEIIGHENAHNWFGNLVTVEYWDHTWIQEGTTEFHAYKGCNDVEPSMQVEDYFVADGYQFALNTDASGISPPLALNITHPDQSLLAFNGLTYYKGASCCRMIEYFVTEPTYNAAMTNYLNRYAYNNTVQDQYFEEITQKAFEDGTLDPSLTVKMIMDTWTLQPGFPGLSVQRNTDGTALLTQERFFNSVNMTDSSTWYIPVTFTTQSNPDFDTFNVIWMYPNETQKTITGMPPPGEWVIFNVQSGAFIRVNYDIDSWNDISNQLNTDHTVIHVMNRIALIADAFTYANTERLSYELPLAMCDFLKSETEFSVLDTGTTELDYIDAMFRTQTTYGALKSFLLQLIVPTYESVGFYDSTSDPFQDQRKRELSVSMSCYLDYEPCLANASLLFDLWMQDTDDYTIISPNLKDPVYCHGVGEGGTTEFDALYDRYLKTIFPTEQSNLIYGMGCSQDQAILNRYLDMAFNEASGISKSDVSDVMRSISSTVVGESVGWDYIRNNDDAIAAYMGSYDDVAQYVYIVSENFNTESRLQELEAFRDENLDELGIASMVDQAIARTEDNIIWMDLNYEEVLTWLNNNGYFP